MPQEVLVVADQKDGIVQFLEPGSGALLGRIDGVVLAEHAGILPLGGGRCAFVDDAGGALIVAKPFVRDTADADLSSLGFSGNPVQHRISVAIPGEHLACDPAGRFIAVTTGLGRSWDAWSDLLTVVDLDADGGPRSRRVRTRAGEPGVVVADTPSGPHAVVRHRQPGGIESLAIERIMDEGVHCPQLRGEQLRGEQLGDLSDDGHGDAYDPATGTMFVASERGMERFDVRKPHPEPLETLPWTTPGRAYFLRFCPRRRILAAVLREGGGQPRDWDSWHNALWIHDVDAGLTRTAPLGDGLIFRFALTATGVAVARVHPDGDDLTVLELGSLTERGRWELPAMDHAPRPGHEPWDSADRRAVAGSPSSEVVAVTRGGHGELHLVDTAVPGSPLRTLAMGTPLRDGGHLGWLASAQSAPGDTVGR